jgi:hypothetical protein
VTPPSVVVNIDWTVPCGNGPVGEPGGALNIPTEHTETLAQENDVSAFPAAGNEIDVHVVPPSTVLKAVVTELLPLTPTMFVDSR